MAVAIAERAEEREATAPQRPRHPGLFGPGGRDPVENGRKGGLAPHRSATAHAAKLKVLASKNGAANLGVLRLELEAERARGLELYRKDKELVELDTWIGTAKEELERVLAERQRVEAELEERRAQLATDDGLAALVREVGRERLARVVELLGWFDDVDDDESRSATT
jgi:hypothetical protein